MEWNDKVVVVTGAAGGIGRALCRRIAAEPVRGLVMSDLDTAATRAAADAPGCSGHHDDLVVQVYPRSNSEHGNMLGHAVRSDRWRYVEWQKKDGSIVARELYDLQNDPGESKNLADDVSLTAVVAEHSKSLAVQLGKSHPKGLALLDPARKSEANVKPDSKPKPAQDRVALFKRKDKNGDGKLTREEFLANQPDPDKAPARFPKFDRNGDGVLSQDEFVKSGRP